MNDDLQSSKSLRILSFGAGAIGTYIGGSLALSGYPVTFLETPEVVTQLRQNGLRLEIQGEVKRLAEPRLAANIEEAIRMGPYDAAIFALKSYDTRRAIEPLVSYYQQMPPILCLQNGVENEPYLASVFGTQNVIAGTVTSSVNRRAAGDAALERLRGVGIANQQPLSRLLVEAFNQAGLNAQLFPDALSMKWSKLITNLPANAGSAILDMTPGEIFSDRRLFQLEIKQLREALAVMRAQNIPVTNLPGTPVKLFAFAIRDLPLPIARIFLKRAIGGGRGGKMPSFHIDLHHGRSQNEVTYLNGAVADYGDRLNIPTPVNRFLTDTLLALALGKLPLNTYAKKPQKLLDALNPSQ